MNLDFLLNFETGVLGSDDEEPDSLFVASSDSSTIGSGTISTI